MPSASFLGDFPHAAKHEDEAIHPADDVAVENECGLIEGDKIDSLKTPVGAAGESCAKTYNKFIGNNDVLVESH